MLADKKIVLVYDRVNTTYGGAEAVILALKKLYPHADLATSVYDNKKAKWAKNFKIQTSFLQKIPFAKKQHRLFAPLMPIAFETLDLSAYDIIISVTSAEAKAVITRSDQFHLCYLLTPPRYLYHYQENYWQNKKILNWPIIKKLAQLSLNYLKKYDQLSIHRPDSIIPIAQIVNQRLEKYYQKKAPTIIYPPVNVKLFEPFLSQHKEQEQKESYYLIVSRLVPYKNIDLAIKACVKLGEQLIIVGDGPEYKKLKKLIADLLPNNSKQIILLKNVNTTELSQLYGHAEALLMPGIDDFGITALEANLHALPVIINQHSGASEILEDQKHALHLNFPLKMKKDEESTYVEELCHQMKKLKESNFDPGELQKNALKYDTTSFMRKFNQQLAVNYRKFCDDRQ